MGREKNEDDLFRDLLALEAAHADPSNTDIPSGLRQYAPPSMDVYDWADDDETETFITSKETAQAELHRREEFGDKPLRDDGIIEESVHFKRYQKRREHKYTEKELEEIRKSCEVTIVHDYGEFDIYHMSDEERAENDMLHELSDELNKLKRTYRKVDEYVEAMRTVVAAWELLERTGNFIHSKDEFFDLVGAGQIYCAKIITPKLKRIDSYDMDMIIKYISNPDLDAADLVLQEPEEDDFLLDDEHEERPPEFYLTDEEKEWLATHRDDPPELKIVDLKKKYVEGYNRSDFGGRGRKPKRKMSKGERAIAQTTHDILNKIENNPANRDNSNYYNRSYFVTHSMFEPREKPHSFWDDIHFNGSWASEEDAWLLDLIMQEEIMKQHPPREKYLTYADKSYAEFFNGLESYGMNVVHLRQRFDCPTDTEQQTERRKSRKENKKLEIALVKRVEAMNNDPKFKKLVKKAEGAISRHYVGGEVM